MGVSDPYAAFCLDEACYVFGSHVDAELSRAAEGAKNEKAASRKREMALRTLLQPTPKKEPEMDSANKKVPKLDPDDPVSPETAARMPPAKKFHGMKFADPADRFSNA